MPRSTLSSLTLYPLKENSVVTKLASRAPKAARAPKAPISSVHGKKADTVTYEGAPGFSRKAKSELFLLAVTNMVGEKTYYEDASKRDGRFEKLVREIAMDDPDWIARFVPYLRDVMNMRSASIVMAAELVHAKLTKPVAGSTIRNRTTIDAALKRADEPAELIGYWMSQFGKNLPQPVKRGLADAVTRMYNERSLIKYDGGDKPIRFGDVIELTHPEAKVPWQSSLFKYAIDSRHKRDAVTDTLESLGILSVNRSTMSLSDEDFRTQFSADLVENGGLTWEQASSKYGKLDAKFWEAMIPSMGIFAVVRNLRNFDDAGISKEARAKVVAKLTDPETIRKSRMFPLRFFQALEATKTLYYAQALEEAINLATSNVPRLPGKTLIMVDVSGSMDYPLSDMSNVKRLAPASIFGAALAVRAENADLVAFSSTSKNIPFRKDASVLLVTKDIVQSMLHQGTNTWDALRTHLKDHDRVVILTDEQASYGSFIYNQTEINKLLSDVKRLYTFNLAGYSAGQAQSGKKNSYTFGGLTDAGFSVIELLERGEDASWPF
jgi:hypothetical protein